MEIVVEDRNSSKRSGFVSKPSDRPALETPKSAPVVDPAAQAAGQRIEVDDAKAISSYANFCRVTGTPEEVIIDFGLNTQPFSQPPQSVIVSQRIVTNYYTAKRLLHALQITVQRHEAAFGVLETDVQKRVVGGR